MWKKFALALTLILSACSTGEYADGGALYQVRMIDGQGRLADLAAFRGRPLVVNFWASWCAPCRAEVPELTRIATEHRAAGLQVIGIGVGETLESARQFAAALGIDYPLLLSADKSGDLMRTLGNTESALPYTVALDSSGRITGRKLGLMRRDDADGLARAALRR